MKRIYEFIIVYLIGVIFIITMALGVNVIEKESISNTSIANNYSPISNYN